MIFLAYCKNLLEGDFLYTEKWSRVVKMCSPESCTGQEIFFFLEPEAKQNFLSFIQKEHKKVFFSIIKKREREKHKNA